MKKDFSQILEVRALQTNLIIRDSASDDYLIYTSTQKYEQDFCHILSLNVDANQQISLQLAKCLYENSLALNSFRELARQSNVYFSFADDTPGIESTSVCVLADVDVIDNSKLDQEKAKASFVNIHELLSKLLASPYMGGAVDRGIARLIYEEEGVL